MRKALAACAVAALLFLFLVANRGAYEGYFSGDDLDNIGWTRQTPLTGYLVGLVTPEYYPQHFRPIGHLTYRILAGIAGLEFRWYVALIQLLHLVNTTLVWLLLRRLGFGLATASSGALFFVFHMALFDAVWKPMFLFDVFCGLFSLLCLLSYAARRWIWSFLFFWLAYKSKEHAAMLPLVLAAYEWWLGERRFKRLIPFFAVSVVFGGQAIWANRGASQDYTLSVAPQSLVETLWFYLQRILVFPLLGLAVLAAPLLRDRKVYFGIAACWLMLAPMLALPNRTYAAYLYTAVAGLTIAFAAIAARFHWAVLAGFFLLWLPANYLVLRDNRKAALTIAQENRAYVDALGALPARLPAIRRFIYEGSPQDMKPWGIAGALRYVYDTLEIEVFPVEDRNLSETFRSGGVALLSWDAPYRKLEVVARAPDEPDAAYLEMKRPMPVWQLEEGWYPLENRYRWIKPRASARLWRPAAARRFELHVNVGPQYIADVKRSVVRVLVAGEEIGAAEYTRNGWQKTRFAVGPGARGEVKVEFHVEPEYQPSKTDPRRLGIAIAGFGFPPEKGNE